MRITNPRSERTSKFFEIDGEEALKLEDPTPREGIKLGLRRNLSGFEILRFWEKEGKRIAG